MNIDKIDFKMVDSPENMNRPLKPQKNALNIITPNTYSRVRSTIANWIYAIDLAESHLHDRNELLDIYKTTVLDASVASKLEMRSNKVILQDFSILDKDGERAEDLEKIFKGTWFRDFMRYSLEAKWWGFSFIQFLDIKDSKISGVESIDRFYILPDTVVPKIRKDRYSRDGIEVTEFDGIFIGKRKDLGLLSKLAQYQLYKKEVLSSYNNHIQLFGSPTRIAKISPNSTTSQVQLREMLKHSGDAGWGIFSDQTEIEFLTANNSGNNVYDMLINYLDEQISLLINGAANADNQSNYAQANKDSDTEQYVTIADRKDIEDIINTQLIPFMIERLGFSELEGCYYKFQEKDALNIKEQFDIDAKLLEHFELDEEYLINKYGSKIIGKKTQPIVTQEPNTEELEEEIRDKIKYEDIFNTYYKNNK